jgi:hypothetical protein
MRASRALNSPPATGPRARCSSGARGSSKLLYTAAQSTPPTGGVSSWTLVPALPSGVSVITELVAVPRGQRLPSALFCGLNASNQMELYYQTGADSWSSWELLWKD